MKNSNRSKKIQEEMKSLRYKEKYKVADTLEKETENKVNAIEYYNNLSDADKLSFQEQLQKRKLRDNYGLYLKYVNGENYILTPFHTALAKICQSVVMKIENGEHPRVLLSVPPQFGKLLANDTPILTRNGWKKHGDLVVGDEVVNEKGDFVKVLNVFPKQYANKKVIFTNGEEILCHENHEWVVYDRFAHRQLVRETKFMEQCVEENNTIGRGHRFRFQLPLTNFVKGETKDFYVNPYVLGVWLGDGKRDCGTICACPNDEITLLECRKYYPQGFNLVHKTTGVLYKNFNGLATALKKYGLCSGKIKTKFIPQEYLTADIRQRLELLAGLIDTDGHLDSKHNRYYFTTSDIELRDSFCELVSTFGWRTTIVEHKPILSTSGIQGKKPFWVVGFNPTTFIPCRIKRKQISTFSKQRRVSICKIEDIEQVEGNCIEVEGGVYLCGKTMIPTHNSMTITETLPSWFLGRNPDLSVIITAYNADIAEKFGDRNRQKVKEFGKEIFGIEISDSQDNKTLFQIKKHQGQMFSAGILGGLTSNPSALTIVDDPFKNGVEAENQDIRDRVFDTFRDSVATRSRALGSGIIVIHTRWHEDDLIGRLLEQEGWVYINIPCVWEKGEDKLLHRKVGEVLCPELGHTQQWAENVKNTLGSRVWNALYQGKPYVEGGNIIKRENIKFYDKHSLPMVFDELTLSCDLSFGGTKANNDPNCLVVWGRVGGNHYLLKHVMKKCGFQETINDIKMLCSEFPAMRKKLIEKKANGSATIELLNQHISGIIPFDPLSNSKEARFKLVAPYFESGNIYLPSEKVDKDSEEIVSQLLKFPNVAHDEYVDTTSQYLLDYSYKNDGGRVMTDSGFKSISKAIRGFRV